MYFTHALSFGIGWCLAFLVLYFLFKERSKKDLSSRNIIDSTALNNLLQKLESIEKQFGSTRFEELKNRESAYSRNPKAFDYDYNGFFKEHDNKVKSLDKELKDIIDRCNELIQETQRKRQMEEKREEKISAKDQLTILNIIGIIVIILVNIVFFTKLF